MKKLKHLFLSSALCLIAGMTHAETIMVSAAASLTDAFTEIGLAFEQKHPQDKIEFNFAAAGTLLQQIAQGAPVDVFASADQEVMDRAQAQNIIKPKTRVNFTSNTLVVITLIDSALNITSLEDLLKPDIRLIALGNPNTTPIGGYIQKEFQKKNLWKNFENKMVLAETVRQSLNYVIRSEVDAGFVFATDVKTTEDKVKVAYIISAQKSNPFVYPMAVTASSSKTLAEMFVAFVLSSEGQMILEKYGFAPVR